MNGKKSRSKRKVHIPIRLNILFFIVFTLFAILILRLGFLQIVYGEDYKNEVEQTNSTTVTKNVPRGEIYDRNFKKLVANKPENTITYTRSSTTKTAEMIATAKKLSTMITVDTDNITERDLIDYWIIKHPKEAKANTKITDKEAEKIGNAEYYAKQVESVTKPQLAELTTEDKNIAFIYRQFNAGYALTPVNVKSKDVTDIEIAKVSENLSELPGVDTAKDWVRSYRSDTTLRSILGSVTSEKQGLPDESLQSYLALGYARNDRVGQSYVEQQYEALLRGAKAEYSSETDSSGNVISTIEDYAGKKGSDVVLTIDADLQAKTDKIIKDTLRMGKTTAGSVFLDRAYVVITNPKTGEILTLAGQQYKKGKFEDDSLGTFTSSYVMGSAIKGATVMAGYTYGKEPGYTEIDEPIELKGTEKKSSWFNRTGSIAMNDISALRQSSNVYMMKTALDIAGATYVKDGSLDIPTTAFDKLRKVYAEFGLGTTTGIDLPGEATGIIGTETEPGKYLDLSYGQYDGYTPLQLNQYVSTIANNGYRIAPHILGQVRDATNEDDEVGALQTQANARILNKIDLPKNYFEQVQKGFYEVMNNTAGGTTGGTGASYFAGLDYKVAGKTGTAESFYAGPDWDYTSGIAAPAVWNTTFVGYAPYDDPEIAVSVAVPWAYTGDNENHLNMIIAKGVFDAYFNLQKERAKKADGTDNALKITKEDN
ncbi:peptidoglycan D,D-transpeptidase FtsI family protein [Brochothrix campestris]|uniref:peptidoglycan D,D-transpeptidase FtsI family protein n=1 Tax=Brochothrix campestris TaxID=2757 RepID=UPI001E2D968D|nr:penicillin-binding protein 2 [Brochothrix campestris]